MKRLLTLILALMMVLSLCACGGTATGKPAESDSQSEQKTPDKEYALGETVEVDDVRFTLTTYRYVDEVEGTCLNPDHFYGTNTIKTAKSGCQMVYLEYTIENNRKKMIANDSQVKVHLEYKDGYMFGTDWAYYDYFDAKQGPHAGRIYCSDISPLESKKFRHIIQDAPIDINRQDIPVNIVVEIMGTEVVYHVQG